MAKKFSKMEGNFAARDAKTRWQAGYARVYFGPHSNRMRECARMQDYVQPGLLEKSYPSAFRVLIVLLIMFDTLRRIFEGVRPIDRWMFWIELLILVFIVWEFVWKVRDWHRERRRIKQHENDMTNKLAHIRPEAAEALCNLILRGEQPASEVFLYLQPKVFPLIERDFIGWLINVEYRDYARRWATEREKNRRSTNG